MDNTNLDKQEKILFLFDILFQNLGNIQILVLRDLLNETTLLKLMLTIEPDIYLVSDTEEIVLTGVSSSEIDKYTNFVEIFHTLRNYFTKTTFGFMLKSDFDLGKILSINELIKGNQAELITLSELLLVLSAISSKRDDYLNIIGALNEKESKYSTEYMNIIDKYINFNQETEIVHTRDMRKRLTARITVMNREKLYFNKGIELYENEISNLKQKNEELTNLLLDVEIRYHEALKETELIKKTAERSTMADEDAFNDALRVNQLKNEVWQKEYEYEEIKKECELTVKRLKEEIKNLQEIKEKQEDKIEELLSLKSENEKLKIKVKEANINKEKMTSYDGLILSVESKNKQIERLIKEKQCLINDTERLTKENTELKEKLNSYDYEKKKIDFEIVDIKRNAIKQATAKVATYKEKEVNLMIKEIYKNEETLDKINQLYIQALEDNNRLNEEKSEILKQLDIQSNQVNQLHSENERLSIEKDKSDIARCKLELQIQHNLLNEDKIENERNKYIESINSLKNTIQTFKLEKENLVKELDQAKLSEKKSFKKAEILHQEKKNWISEIDTAKPSHIKMKPSEDISKLKSLLQTKSDQIKKLTERVSQLERIEKIRTSKDQHQVEESSQFKKSYLEQSRLVSEEHDLLSNKLCQLAMQFVSFKNELIKKIK